MKNDATPTVLVVDDEEMVRRFYRTALERNGYRVLTADNGLEGVACAEIERPDAILMDFQMPKLDGLEATRRLGASPDTASIPVIGLTGHATRAAVIEMKRAGGTDVVVKSDVRVADLVRRIDEAILRSIRETNLRGAESPRLAIARPDRARVA